MPTFDDLQDALYEMTMTESGWAAANKLMDTEMESIVLVDHKVD